MIEENRTLLSPDQLIQVECLCDSYEMDLRNGVAVDQKEVIAKATSEIRETLKIELDNILLAHRKHSESQTQTANEQTVSPDDFVFQTDRIVEFSSLQPQTDSGQNSIQPGQRFGRFQLHSIAGRGGAGVVWRAFDGNLDRWVALKLAHVHSVNDPKRFVREAQAVAQLKHPNIIPVYEAGELNGRCFLVSEFCEGQPLSQVIDGQAMNVRQAVSVVATICQAIIHSHENGIIHRDLKPQNILLNSAGQPMVTDFGLAKNLVHDQTLTQEGELIGTPGYMAPEQAKGGALSCDERTDIYSIGVILFQLLTGKLPFSGGFERIVFQVIHSAPPLLRSLDHSLPVELESICAKCLEKSPEQRFQTAQELLDELNRFNEGQTVLTRKVTLAGRYARWLRREPRIAWSITAAVTSLVIVAGVSTYSSILLSDAWKNEKAQVAAKEQSLKIAFESERSANRAKIQAEDARNIAKKNAELARQLAEANRKEANFLASVFAPVDLMGVNQMAAGHDNGSHILSEKSIENAVRQANHLLADAPIVQSRIKGMLANAWRSQGQLAKAETLLEESTQLLNGNLPYDEQALLDAKALNQLYRSYLLHHCEDYARSDASYQKAIALFQQLVDSNPTSRICKLQLAQAEFGLGASLLRQKRNKEAQPYLKKVLDTRRKLLANGDSLLLATELAYLQCDPKNSWNALPKVLESIGSDVTQKAMKLYWSTVAKRKRGEFEIATQQYRELIQLIEENVGINNWLYPLAVGDFAGMQWEAGNYVEAFERAKQAIQLSKSFARWHPKRMQAIRLLTFELRLAKRYDEAKQLMIELSQHEDPNWSDSTGFHSDMAWAFYHCDQPEETLQHSRVALEAIGNCTGAETAWHCYTHSIMLRANHRDEANQYMQQAIDSANQLIENEKLPQHSTWLGRVAIVLTEARKHQQAERVFRKAIDWAGKEYFPTHPRVAGWQVQLAQCLLKQDKTKAAIEELERALAIQEAKLPANDIRLVETQNQLAKLRRDSDLR